MAVKSVAIRTILTWPQSCVLAVCHGKRVPAAAPAAALGDFVRSLAHRIASFPAAGHVVVKDRVNAIAFAPAEDFRRDSALFIEGVRKPEIQGQIQAAMKHGFQNRDGEMALARLLGDLADVGSNTKPRPLGADHASPKPPADLRSGQFNKSAFKKATVESPPNVVRTE